MKNYLNQRINSPVNVPIIVEAWRDQVMNDGSHNFIHIPNFSVRLKNGSVIHGPWTMNQSSPVKDRQTFHATIAAATGVQTWNVEYQIGGSGEWQTKGTFKVSWEGRSISSTRSTITSSAEATYTLNANETTLTIPYTAITTNSYNDGTEERVGYLTSGSVSGDVTQAISTTGETGSWTINVGKPTGSSRSKTFTITIGDLTKTITVTWKDAVVVSFEDHVEIDNK